MLISGPPGIGKLALARAMAQYIHCQNPTPEGDSCGRCQSCMLHASHSHPDLGFTFPTSGSKGGNPLISADFIQNWNEFLDHYPLAPYEQWLLSLGNENAQPTIKVLDTREIIRKMNIGNYSANKKIMIIWMPEKLQPEAANRLLKLIEEPEDGKLFIMVSSAPEDILPTIYSRLQRINLHPLESNVIYQWLVEGFGANSAQGAAAASLAEGSMQKALDYIREEGERKEFFDLFCSLMRLAYMRNVADLKTWSETAASLGREKLRRLLAFMARMIRENFIYNLSMPELNVMTEDENAFSSRFARFVHSGNVELISHEIDTASRDIYRNCNAKIVMFDFAIAMIMAIRRQAV